MKKITDKLTKRNYEIELRAEENQTGIIEGVPIVFDKQTIIHDFAGDFKEVISRDALNDCDLKDVLLCINHDTNKIALARTKNGKGTMQLEIKEDGLHMRAKLDIENNTEARALYSAIQRGDVNGMSFMFRVKKDKWTNLETEMPERRIEAISVVHEVSVVNFPAYNQTTISARDSKESESILTEARKVLKEIKNAENDKLLLELEKLKYFYFLGDKK